MATLCAFDTSRRLLSLPSRPLVVLVEHCMVHAWKPAMACDRAAAAPPPRCRPAEPSLFEEMRRFRTLAEHCSCLKEASALSEDGAPCARPVAPGAQAAPTHPRA